MPRTTDFILGTVSVSVDVPRQWVKDVILNVDIFRAIGHWSQRVSSVKSRGDFNRYLIRERDMEVFQDEDLLVAEFAHRGRQPYVDSYSNLVYSLPKGYHVLDEFVASKALGEGVKLYGVSEALTADTRKLNVMIQKVLFGTNIPYV